MILQDHPIDYLFGKLLRLPASAPALAARRLPLAPAQRISQSHDPLAATVLQAIDRGQGLAIYYHGGSTRGALRHFRPDSLYRLRSGGPLYVDGHCLLRDTTRTLRLDRIRLA